MNLIRPIAERCPNCSELTRPTLSKSETRTHFITEGVWSCKKCGAYFRKSVVETVEKQPISQ
jgi:hypothetical protein